MLRFISFRVLAVIPVVIGASIFSFSLIHLAPGDPVDVLLGPYATQEDRASMRAEFALDEPLPIQYATWLGQAAVGDLGTSIQMRSPVTSVLIDRFVNTLKLGVLSFGLAVVIGFAAGALAALRTDGLLDRTLQTLVVFSATVPVFWLGLVLIYWFSIRLSWFPAAGMGPVGQDPTLLESAKYLVLPVLTTVGIPAAIIARSARSAVLEVLHEDFVWAARGRGVRGIRLFVHHIGRPVLPNVLHVSGLQFAYLVGGTLVFAEVVFSWPGIGLQTINAVAARDIPMIQGVVLLAAIVTVVTNLVVDMIHYFVDPRADLGQSTPDAWR